MIALRLALLAAIPACYIVLAKPQDAVLAWATYAVGLVALLLIVCAVAIAGPRR